MTPTLRVELERQRRLLEQQRAAGVTTIETSDGFYATPDELIDRISELLAADNLAARKSA